MNLEKFTDRAKGFLQSAQTVAIRLNHQQVRAEHLAKALLEDCPGVAKLLRIASLADVKRYDDRMAARHHGTLHEAAEGSVHNADLGARAPLRRSSSMDDLVDRGQSKSDDAAGGGGAKTPPASRRDDGRVLANLLGVEPERLF